MRRYARRHYGLDTHLLKEPKVVVEHFTAGDTYASARNTSPPTAPTSASCPAPARTS